MHEDHDDRARRSSSVFCTNIERARSARAPAARRCRTSCATTSRPVCSRSKKSSDRRHEVGGRPARAGRGGSASPIRRDEPGSADRPKTDRDRPRRRGTATRRGSARPRRCALEAVVDAVAHERGPASRHAVWHDEQQVDDARAARGRDAASARARRQHLRALLGGRGVSLVVDRARVPTPPASSTAHPLLGGAASRSAACASTSRYRSDSREQLVVGAFGDDAAVVEQHHPVGERDRRRPVGDDDRRPSAHHLARARRGSRAPWSGRPTRCASSRMSTRGSARIAARDRDALALSAGQREAVLAETSRSPSGSVVDELVGAREARGRAATCSASALRVGEGDVRRGRCR